MTTSVLFKAALWQELAARIPKAKRVRAAIAYIGTGGARLLPLRRGDVLVVDMSLRSVGSGATNPSEIQKLLRRGVKVFTRDSLHAKFLIIDRFLIAGSSNISRHAKEHLDELALLTTDESARHEAETVFTSLCLEPVSEEYLARCIKAYRPPRHELDFEGRRSVSGRASNRLWILAGHSYGELPEEERTMAKEHTDAAAKRLEDYERFEVDYAHYARAHPFLEQVRFGDSVIVGITDGRGVDIEAPARVLGVTSHARRNGRRRYILLVEKHSGSKRVRWTNVRAALRGRIPALDRPRPRTRQLRDPADADLLRSLWDGHGRFKGAR